MKKLFSIFLLTFSLSAMSDVRVGNLAPDFKLKDLSNNEISLSSFKGKFVVLEWFNKDCPFVKKHYGPKNMQNLQKEFTDKGVVWIVINSNAKGKQGNESVFDSINTQKTIGSNASHYLIDEEGVVARAYNAKTTPHMFVMNPDQKVIYTGAIDSIASADVDDIKLAKNYVRDALNAAFNKKEVAIKTSTPYGCSVKLK